MAVLVDKRFFISTHALTEGDYMILSISISLIYFNSRPHGGRRELLILFREVNFISTHALTEGDNPNYGR